MALLLRRNAVNFLIKWGEIQGDDFTAHVLETLMSEGEIAND